MAPFRGGFITERKEAMSAIEIGQGPCPSPKSPRSKNRAAWWRRDLDRTASYLMDRAGTDRERDSVERLYSEALAGGPDFTHYRARSAFAAAPRLGIDRNAYARILKAIDVLERGTYRHCREKGKQGLPRTAARVLKCLLGLALHYGEVRPSYKGIARLACVCKQTVANCLKLLELYGFVVIHRRIKRIRTVLGVKVVQDTNAYTIQEPMGLAARAAAEFRNSSESRKWPASSSESLPIRKPERAEALFDAPPDSPGQNRRRTIADRQLS